MKTFLLFLCSLVVVRANSQCTVSDIFVQNVTVDPVQSPGTCTVKFDATFAIEDNNGNKYIFLHAWTQQDYPNYFQCVNGQSTINGSIRSPDASDLGNEFLTIAINNNVTPAELLPTYTPDPSVPITPVDSIRREVLPDGRVVFYLFGITATLPSPCTTPNVIVADLWSSQSAAAQRAHCVNCGIRSSAGFTRAVGIANCATMSYIATITNNTANPITGNYRVFADVNGDNYFNPAIDTLIDGPGSFSIAGGVGMTTTVSGPIPAANMGQDLFLVITLTSGPGDGASRVVFMPSTICSPLPVTFSSFTGRRTNQSAVSLRWETVTEIDNSGFILQRSYSNNRWENLAFIPSQAMAGNSTSQLVYTYSDMNNNRGISQYRLQQVDIDGHTKFSNILSIRGFGQAEKTLVYPNPSTNGNFTIVFEEARAEKREVKLIDMNGRIIRQWNSVTGNTLQANGIQPGIYSIQVTVPQTGERSIEKLVVMNR